MTKTTMMKAWQITGWSPERLALVERPVPMPAPHEVLIRVGAVSLNYRDKLVVEGALLERAPSLPFTPASDMAGEVVATGGAVSRFRPGDRVASHFWTRWADGAPPPDLEQHGLGGPLPGVLADYVVLHEEFVVPAPTSLSVEETATLPIAYLTAWFALMEVGGLKPGQTVVLEGTGGVSLAGLQIARAAGARTILTSRGEDKLSRARRLGASETINTGETPDWARRVLALTEGRGADHVLEVLAGDNLAQAAAALGEGGRIALIGFLKASSGTLPALPVMMKHLTLQGITVGHRRAFEAMNRFIDAHDIQPVIDRVYTFEDAARAFAHLDEGPFGKVVIRVGG